MGYNKPLMDRVKARILGEPERFKMGWWFYDKKGASSYKPGKDCDRATGEWCGTAACVAGWTLVEAGEVRGVEVSADGCRWNIEVIAARLLGVEPDEAEEIFHHSYWPQNLYKRYEKALLQGYSKKAALVAIEAVEKWEEKMMKKYGSLEPVELKPGRKADNAVVDRKEKVLCITKR